VKVHRAMRAAKTAVAGACALTLAACGTLSEQTPASQTTTDVMAGRWVLTEPNAPTCGINFNGAAGVQQGALTPEGGCPERFFTSRAWELNQTTLTIKDDAGQPLAQFTFANGQFDGRSTAGTPATLTRQQTP
jgi:hypothetical protein